MTIRSALHHLNIHSESKTLNTPHIYSKYSIVLHVNHFKITWMQYFMKQFTLTADMFSKSTAFFVSPILTDTSQLTTTQRKIIWAILLSTGTLETGRYFWPLIQPPLVQCCLKPWQKNRQQVNPDRSPCCGVLMRVEPFCLFHCARGRNPPTSASQGCSHLYKPHTQKKKPEFFFLPVCSIIWPTWAWEAWGYTAEASWRRKTKIRLKTVLTQPPWNCID